MHNLINATAIGLKEKARIAWMAFGHRKDAKRTHRKYQTLVQTSYLRKKSSGLIVWVVHVVRRLDRHTNK
ncbi:hypothetical protein L596_027512 [Steinernema carpocapsae]|uniref:Uncharacterized protein n=1 Tax=Steinernema carpocapsae TaxID=34508 RepID=A0A4U5LVP9_STECR|nr:hypothetical protein L596_027512 [Steinernema carpocapsae]